MVVTLLAARGTWARKSDATPSETATIASAAGVTSRTSRINCRALNPTSPNKSENVVACRSTTRSRLPWTSFAVSAARSVVSNVDSSATGRSRRT